MPWLGAGSPLGRVGGGRVQEVADQHFSLSPSLLLSLSGSQKQNKTKPYLKINELGSRESGIIRRYPVLMK